jgi:hypothetical protein
MFWQKKNPSSQPQPAAPKKNIANPNTPPSALDKPYRTDRTPLPPFDTGFVYYEEK